MNEYTTTSKLGTRFYYKDKEMTILHREDGPAIEDINGDREWYQNHKMHRMGGPAIEGHDGRKMWFVNDEFIFSVDSRGNIANRME